MGTMNWETRAVHILGIALVVWGFLLAADKHLIAILPWLIGCCLLSIRKIDI